LQITSHLLNRAAEAVVQGDGEAALDAYQAALAGMLRATRDQNGVVGEQTAQYLADALVKIREFNTAILHKQAEVAVEDTLVTSESSLEQPQPEPQQQALPPPPPVEPSTTEEVSLPASDTATAVLPPYHAFISIIMRITAALLNSPLPDVVHSTLQSFYRSVTQLFTSYNISDTLVRITHAGGAVAGWLDRRYSLGQRVGEALAVGAVAGIKVLEAVALEVAKRMEEQPQPQPLQQDLASQLD